MLKVVLRMVKPECEQELRDWLAELNKRRDEVRKTFEQEGVRHEQAHLIAVEGGTALLYVVEAEDQEF